MLPFRVAFSTKELLTRTLRAVDYGRKILRRCVLYPRAWLTRRLRRTTTTVIGITGSAGKTTTKDLCHALLSAFGDCKSNPLTENEHFNVAQTLSGLERRHRYCVVELSGGRPGYLDFALRLSKPDVAVLTLIARDHFSAFKSLEAIADEKGKIVAALPAHGIAVLNIDDPLVRKIGEACNRKVIWVGKSEGATLRLRDARSRWPEPLELVVEHEGKTLSVNTSLHGTHLALPVLMSLGVALALELPLPRVIQALRDAPPPEGRMQAVTLASGISFIRDDWKAPLWSLQAPFEFMKEAQAKRKVLIIGTLSDYSGSASKVYPKVAREALDIGDLIVFVGPHAMRALKASASRAGQELLAFPSVRDASAYLRTGLRAGDLVLLKGSNKADHLVRLILDQEKPVHCWREKCGLSTFCGRCPQLHDGPAPLQNEREDSQTTFGAQPRVLAADASAGNGPIVIAGLGNPGAEYSDTPHNAGHRAIEDLAGTIGGTWVECAEGWVSFVRLGGAELALFKPGLKMNRNGESLRLFLDRVGSSADKCTVIHDDTDLPLGEVRLKRGGGDAGHLGVRSVIGSLGTGGFERIRIGVAADGDTQKARERVLKKFSPAEKALIDGSSARAAQLVLSRVGCLSEMKA